MSELGNKTAWHCCQCGKPIDTEQGYCGEHQDEMDNLLSQFKRTKKNPWWWPK